MVNFPCRNVSGGWMIMLMLILTRISVDNVKKLQEKMKYTEASFSFAGLFLQLHFMGIWIWIEPTHHALERCTRYNFFYMSLISCQIVLYRILPGDHLKSLWCMRQQSSLHFSHCIGRTSHIFTTNPAKVWWLLRHKIWDCSVPAREKCVSWLN